MSTDIAIRVQHVSKTFKLPHDRATSLKSNLINVVKRRRGYELQQALTDINFEVKKGEFYGIVGKNGGGKSTLLKIISGIYQPSKGSVEINGKLTPFIELGVGFNPELSGRDNVYLNGALLGFSRREMEVMYDDIVSFAELERFMDQKLKNYSSGMQVRLAFSIAIRAKSDILVMDEVLAVGDEAFQKKCVAVFRDLKRQGRTIILVTHDMGNVERFCDRVLVIDKGRQLGVMTPAEAAGTYARLNVNEAAVEQAGEKGRSRYGTGEVRARDVAVRKKGKKTATFAMGDDLTLEIVLDRKVGFEKVPLACGLAIYNEDGVNITGPNSEHSALPAEVNTITCTIPDLAFTPGEYTVTIGVYNREKFTDFYDMLDKWCRFTVIADHVTHGVVEIKTEWTGTK